MRRADLNPGIDGAVLTGEEIRHAPEAGTGADHLDAVLIICVLEAQRLCRFTAFVVAHDDDPGR